MTSSLRIPGERDYFWRRPVIQVLLFRYLDYTQLLLLYFILPDQKYRCKGVRSEVHSRRLLQESQVRVRWDTCPCTCSVRAGARNCVATRASAWPISRAAPSTLSTSSVMRARRRCLTLQLRTSTLFLGAGVQTRRRRLSSASCSHISIKAASGSRFRAAAVTFASSTTRSIVLVHT